MLAHYGKIHLLVNLAGGLTRYKPMVDHSLGDWSSELNNNLLSAFLLSRAVFPHLRESGGGASSISRAPGDCKPTWWRTTAPKRRSKR